VLFSSGRLNRHSDGEQHDSNTWQGTIWRQSVVRHHNLPDRHPRGPLLPGLPATRNSQRFLLPHPFLPSKVQNNVQYSKDRRSGVGADDAPPAALGCTPAVFRHCLSPASFAGSRTFLVVGGIRIYYATNHLLVRAALLFCHLLKKIYA
jgi:hypothetical protein